jgi:hypothetical protein
MVFQDATPLKHFFGGLLLGAVVVSLIIQLSRGAASQQDPALDPLLDPAVETTNQDTTDPTLRDDASASTTDSTYKPLRAFLDKHKTLHLSQDGGS